MDLITDIKRMFTTPTPLQMAATELAEAELELLKAETMVEYATSIAAYNAARAKRLRVFIAGQNRAISKAEGTP